ncbi:2-octaprenyl-6-methoxyphenyl hydroxylase [Alteromonadaceae bacterium BrNp21-10]|nr:2-octaprenyl-6-methoxyphenyl hydroxylase [Alteromonadaceae bacterium BrNp21-10]
MHDVIIAGGGTVGCSLALALSELTSLNIAIVEANAYDPLNTNASAKSAVSDMSDADSPQHPGFDARAIALSRHSQQTLDSWGLNTAAIGTAIKYIKVSDQGHLGQCTLDHRAQHQPALGYVVALQDLGQQLQQALAAPAKKSQLHWYCPDQITQVEQQQHGISVKLSQGAELQAKLLVVADGAASPTAKLLGLEFEQQSYGQTALIANVGLSQSHQHWAYERFTEFGPLAILPLGEQRCSLVWSIAPERQEEMLGLSDEDFLAQLQQQFGQALGQFTHVGKRYCYPLSLTTAKTTLAHRALVIGNAAQSLHPIAGQGFNLGLRDVAKLSLILQQAEQQQRDIGEYNVLREYQQQRQQDKRSIIQLTDGLVHLFSNQHWPLVMARNLGLTAMEMLPGAKQFFAAKAMGLHDQQLTSLAANQSTQAGDQNA